LPKAGRRAWEATMGSDLKVKKATGRSGNRLMLGMVGGAVIGIVLGAALGNMGLGLPIGMGIGNIVGTMVRSQPDRSAD
jgi:uncharacterized membrane protein